MSDEDKEKQRVLVLGSGSGGRAFANMAKRLIDAIGDEFEVYESTEKDLRAKIGPELPDISDIREISRPKRKEVGKERPSWQKKKKGRSDFNP